MELHLGTFYLPNSFKHGSEAFVPLFSLELVLLTPESRIQNVH